MPRLTLKILGRDYLFNVSEEDTATLQNAANIINSLPHVFMLPTRRSRRNVLR